MRLVKFTLFKTLVSVLIAGLLIGGIGFLSVNQLKRNARLIVQDSLPGLKYAGSANASLARAYNHLLLFLTSEDAAERAALRETIEKISAETTQNLDGYSKSIYDNQDKRHFEDLVRCREKYLRIRSQVIDLAEEGHRSEAIREFKESLRPAYEEYRKVGETILNYNIQTGDARGHEITAICNRTQFFVAFIAVFLFVAGFLFGLFR